MPQKNHPIKIKFKKGRLHTSDNGHTDADKTDTVEWSLENPDSGLLKIEPKSGAEIFETPPYQNGDVWTGKIRGDAPYNVVCKYEIIYSDNSFNKTYTTRSIISIKPSGINFIASFISLLGLLGFSLMFMQKKKNRNR